MRFKQQTAIARKWGLMLLLVSIVPLLVSNWLIKKGQPTLEEVSFDVFVFFAMLAVVVGYGGGPMRSMSKWGYHNVAEMHDEHRLKVACWWHMRLYLWLDTDGRDRDA